MSAKIKPAITLHLQSSFRHKLPMQATPGVVEIEDDDTDMDSEEEAATHELLHAKTLRLDDCRMETKPDAPTGDAAVETQPDAPTGDAAVWQNKYNELLARLEKLEGGKKPEDAFTTPTPKRQLQTPASTESLCPSPSPPPAPLLLPPVPPQLKESPPALPASGPPVVPKEASVMPCPPKAPALSVAKAPAPSEAKAPAASVAEPSEPTGLKRGEEDLAEEVDLSHEDRAKVAVILVAEFNLSYESH